MKTRIFGAISQYPSFSILIITFIYYTIMPYKIINAINEIIEQTRNFLSTVH